MVKLTSGMNRLTKFSFSVLLFLVSVNSQALQTFKTRVVLLNDKPYALELADTNERQTQGLMYRTKLAQDAGMLFIYSKPGDRRIWMKNTLIPLSVIWLDADARIIDIQLLLPCRVQNCPVYGASALSQYILELHPDAGHRFKAGEILAPILEIDL